MSTTYPVVAVVSWSKSRGDWVGDVLSGPSGLPQKYVFVNGARRGNPQGVTPEEGVPFFTRIVHETNVGTRKGVLFGEPVRPVRFGWVPTDEVIEFASESARKHRWGVHEEGFDHDAFHAPAPREGHHENVRYAELERRKRAFTKGHVSSVICEYGLPDVVEAYESLGSHVRMRLVWRAYGVRECVHVPQLYELVASEVGDDAARAFRAQPMGECSITAPPGQEISVNATFTWLGYDRVHFAACVAEVSTGGRVKYTPLWQVLPEEERARVHAALAGLAPTPEEYVDGKLGLLRSKILRAVAEMAIWSVPGEYEVETRTAEVRCEESYLSDRAGSTYPEEVAYTTITVRIPGLGKDSYRFEGRADRVGALREVRRYAINGYKVAKKRLWCATRYAEVPELLETFCTPEDVQVWQDKAQELCRAQYAVVMQEARRTYRDAVIVRINRIEELRNEK